MGNTQRVEICKHCLPKSKEVKTRLGFFGWICGVCLTVLFYFINLSLTGILSPPPPTAFIPLGIISMVACAYIIVSLIDDLRRKHYYLFLDKEGRLHCDTVAPLLFEDHYYWQMKSELLATQQETVSREDFLIASDVIHWTVGGLRRNYGHVMETDENPVNKWSLLQIPRVNFVFGNPFNESVRITIRNEDGYEVTSSPRDILRWTIDHPQSLHRLARALSRLAGVENDARSWHDLTKEANEKWKDMACGYNQLGQFLIQLRETASTWPQNSKYARENRLLIDGFLAEQDPVVVESWKQG